MKQVFQHIKAGNLEILDVPAPAVKPGGVLVKNHCSFVSPGTERAIIELTRKSLIEKARERPDLVQKVINKAKTEGIFRAWQAVKERLDERIPLGYSCAGEVTAVADDVTEFQIKDKVACAGQGFASHAEIVFVPKNLCVKIPSNVSFDSAALTTIGAIALQGIRRANLSSGERVCIIGLGLIGQIAGQILKAYGFSVLGVDISKKRAKIAQDAGFDKAVALDGANIKNLTRSWTNSVGFDAVLICAATKSSKPVKLAGEITRERGRVIVIGDVGMEIPRRDYYKKEIDFLISRSYGPGRYDKEYEEKGKDYPISYVRWTEKRNMEEFLRLLGSGRLDVDYLINERFKIEDAQEAYDLVLGERKDDILGVILEYPVKDFEEQLSGKPHSTFYLRKQQDFQVLQNSVKIGLIGAGNFAKSVILPILKSSKNVKLIAICDSSGQAVKDAGEKYNADYITTDYKKIIQDENIDLVIAATRHNFHAPIVLDCLQNNKNVFVEKPLCTKQEDLIEIIKAKQNSQARLGAGFNRRFTPHLLRLREEFSDTNTPLMISYRVNAGFLPKDHWVFDAEEGGGRIIGEVCHFIDSLQFIANSKPKKVFASLVPVGGAVQCEDNVILTMDFENGSRGVILYTALGNSKLPKEYIEIYGDGKIIIIDDFKSAKIVYPDKVEKLRKFTQDKGHEKEYKSFIEAVKNGKESPMPFEEIINTTLTTFKVLESIKTGTVVELK